MVDRTTRSIAVPADPAFLRRIAAMLEQRAEWRLLAQVLEVLLELDATDWRARAKLHQAWTSAGQAGRADVVLDEALQLAAAHPGGIGSLRRLFEASGSRGALLRLLAHLHAGNPADADKALQYAAHLEDAGEVAQAKRVVAELLRQPGRSAGSRRLLVFKALDASRPALVEAALEGWLEADAASIHVLASGEQVQQRAEALLAALDGLVDRSQEILLLALGLVGVLDRGGKGDVARRAYQDLESRVSIESAPSRPSPTASTMMYRNRPLLDCLVETVAWQLEMRGGVSIHVGGCSTGEEAFSLAIALAERGLLGQCALSASDVDTALVARAKTGVVDARSVGPMPMELRSKYLSERKDRRFNLDRDILSAIELGTADLGRGTLEQAPFDLLVANNILVHFPEADARDMVVHMAALLKPDGVLCIGGSRQDRLEPALRKAGLVPVTACSSGIFDAWKLQRSAWYRNPRPYWALPPSSWTAAEPWRHTALFARSAEVAGQLQAGLAHVSTP